MGAQFTAFLDANVLYPAPLRDLLMELAVSDLFQARWSNEVLGEMVKAIKRDRADIGDATLQRVVDLMNTAVRDCLVPIPEELVEAIIGLPDQNDRHVVAGAIQSRCHAIVTRNLKDFPDAVLSRYRLEAIDPDRFLVAQYHLDQGGFMACFRKVRLRLKKPPYSVEDYLSNLVRHGLVETVAELRPMARFL